jgi:hypothetical protein
MPMHTWRRADGSYYDDSEPENEDDEPLPLRPSLIHQWTGRKWEWQGKRISHSVPRDDDCQRVSAERVRDMLTLLHESIAVQEYHGRMLEQLRLNSAVDSASLAEHLREAKPLMLVLEDLRKLARISSMIGKLLIGLWKFVVWSVAIMGIIWAIAHGDAGALKRALSLLTGTP